MPKFYFHVSDGQKTYADCNGADLHDAATAQAFARIIVNDLAPEAEYRNYYVDVRDENDTELFKVFITTRH